MFTKEEVKRNLLGSLEVALFMREARTRFGNTSQEALRSFFVPMLLFPLSMLALYFSSQVDVSGNAAMISYLFCLRLVVVWMVSFGFIFWITGEIERQQHFYQFVIASNWITLPAAVALLPVLLLVSTGAYSWEELSVFMMCMVIYSYALTAFVASYILRIPWELGIFISFMFMNIDDITMVIASWVTTML